MVELDRDRGEFAVVVGSDLLGALRASPNGLTAKEAGRFLDGANDKAREVKARRRLDGYVRRELAYKRDSDVPVRYFATPPQGVQGGLG
jgi:hypothetical protein